jgi:hypothetical protein
MHQLLAIANVIALGLFLAILFTFCRERMTG